MPEPRFVIVGTGRSGSDYIARILTASGIPCGGESWWRPDKKPRPDHLIGDSSCCALPQGLDGYKGLVFHQVRHPLDVIQSYLRAPVQEPHLGIFRRLIPDADPTDRLSFTMRFWVACAEKAELYTNGGWWRVDQIDADLVRMIGNITKGPIDDELIEQAFATEPILQHYDNRENPLTWDDLEHRDAELTEHIREVAHRYGF